MIPVKLTLRNFMCYRDNVPTLDLSGIHVACLCGNNGQGKSALIDAISWSLWGKARARTDDELINSTQKQMEVDFEFSVNKSRYRVIRKHSRAVQKLSGHTFLEFLIESGERFRPITGNTIRETQRKIIDVLRMDYETFINSALFLQGRADEFTVKSPAERKKILSDILNLSFYDKLEAKAKELARQKETECKILESAIEEIKRDLDKKGEYQIKLQDVGAELMRFEAQVKSQENLLNQLRRTKDRLILKKKQLKEVENRIKATEIEIRELEVKVPGHRQKIEEYKRILAKKEAILKKYAALVALREENEKLSYKLTTLHNLTERKNKLEQDIQKRKMSLLTNKAMLEREIKKLEIKIEAESGIEADLVEVQEKFKELKRANEELLEKKHQIEEFQSQIQYLKAVNARQEEEMKDLRFKTALISQGETRCPLCGAELGASGIEEIVAKYESESQVKTKEHSVNENKIKKDEENYRMLKDEAQKLGVRINKESALVQSREIVLKSALLERQRNDQELNRCKSDFSQIVGQLKTGKLSEKEQIEVENLTSRMKSLGYDDGRHRIVREQISELEKYDDLKRKVDEAEKLLNQEEILLSYTEEGIKKRRSTLKVDFEMQQSLSRDLSDLSEANGRIKKAEAAYENLRLQREQRLEVKAALEENLRRCAEREREKEEKISLLNKLSGEKGIYSELSAAFGKKGVQALIIEQALPEIEEESNRLLGKMTDNRLSLGLESQRETRKGEITETLDIKIQDELGTRNYEMLSGGEAFRVNFALRIAISKLLVKRAGAPFLTLFIDEGFGTQDGSGKEKLIEVINSIQEEFEKIIVITHIEELKDVFPVRIEINKTPRGSTFTVN